MLCAHCRWGMEVLHICTASWPYSAGDELLDNLSLDTAQSCINKVLGVNRYIKSSQTFVLFPVLIQTEVKHVVSTRWWERKEASSQEGKVSNSVPAALFFPFCFPTVCYVKATHEKARRENKKESTVHPFLWVSTEGEKSCCNTMGGPETHLKIRKETEPLQESANTDSSSHLAVLMLVPPHYLGCLISTGQPIRTGTWPWLFHLAGACRPMQMETMLGCSGKMYTWSWMGVHFPFEIGRERIVESKERPEDKWWRDWNARVVFVDA